METKQTAVKWLLEQWPILESQIPLTIINNALQMEREQITDAWNSFGESIMTEEFDNAEQYYNDTYGGKDER